MFLRVLGHWMTQICYESLRKSISVWLIEVLSLEQIFTVTSFNCGRSRLLRGLRRGCGASRLLGMRVRIRQGRRYLSFVSVVSVVKYRPLRRADHSSREVLLTVVCLSVIVKRR